MKHKRYLLLLVLLAISLVAGPARAEEGERVTLGRGQAVRDDFYAAGRMVEVLGNITGDLMAAGDSVTSEGDIGGDVLVASRTLNISGTVGGDVRAAGQNISLDGQVGRAVTVFGQQLAVKPGANVGRNLMFGGERLELAGAVGGNVRAWVDTVTVSGRVDGNLEIEADHLELLPGAQVKGDIMVKGANPPLISEGAEIKGRVNYIPLATEAAKRMSWWQILGRQLLSLAKLLGLALLMALLAAPFLRAEVEELRAKPWTGLGVGLGWLVLAPLAIILLVILVVGQAAAWVLGIVYVGLIFAAGLLFKPVLGAFLGQWLLARFGDREFSLVWETLLGAMLLWLLGLIPVVGGIITVVGVIITLGSWLVLLARYGLAWPRRIRRVE
ncbi:Polymer-forming cytoskeletal [Neomoorella glycerini]|uniref:Polymer-forming cytoskeletal n=1 Tax=Neomoorella glycerini TaxID=55779 RepID=A0A6I5ZRG7_9FIRM|nr:polymer-forming cytoskeletal protein [Moorella glycerini]QGP92338.1 Polymer-forming cytoskeletal [Moorella glycerini]